MGRINDAVRPSGHPNIFHLQCASGDFAKGAFAKPATLESLAIHGRTDCRGSRDLFNYVFYRGLRRTQPTPSMAALPMASAEGMVVVTSSPCTSMFFSFTRALKAGDRLAFRVSNNGTESSDSTG